jgi:hypothetical protein
MLAVSVVLLRTLGLLCSGHRAVVVENVALRQQLSVLRRTVRNMRRMPRCSRSPSTPATTTRQTAEDGN